MKTAGSAGVREDQTSEALRVVSETSGADEIDFPPSFITSVLVHIIITDNFSSITESLFVI